jgi:hypothetical protein
MINMAITANKTETNLVIKYPEGVDLNGRDIIKSQKFSGVKTTALDQEIYDVANALGKLMPKPIVEIIKNDGNALVSE